jgi:hypothetical protein
VWKQKSRKEKDYQARKKTLPRYVQTPKLNTAHQARGAKEDHNHTQQKTTTKIAIIGKEHVHKQTHNSDTQEPIQVKLFTIITDKVITMMKIRCGRALDELTGSNKGKIRLLSRAKEKKYSKGKRNGSRYR